MYFLKIIYFYFSGLLTLQKFLFNLNKHLLIAGASKSRRCDNTCVSLHPGNTPFSHTIFLMRLVTEMFPFAPDLSPPYRGEGFSFSRSYQWVCEYKLSYISSARRGLFECSGVQLRCSLSVAWIFLRTSR